MLTFFLSNVRNYWYEVVHLFNFPHWTRATDSRKIELKIYPTLLTISNSISDLSYSMEQDSATVFQFICDGVTLFDEALIWAMCEVCCILF